MGGRRARYTRRVDTFRRKIAEAIEASAAGELGVVFLLQHYEHPTALCAAIEAIAGLGAGDDEPGWGVFRSF
jgi:hypothetical protein